MSSYKSLATNPIIKAQLFELFYLVIILSSVISAPCLSEAVLYELVKILSSIVPS